MNIEIRDLKAFDDMLNVQRLQQAIWHFKDHTGIYPPSLLAFADNGGLVLGAYDADTGAMVGFCFGFLARHTDGQLKLYSQAMGVLPEYRQAGVAYRLKCRQREWALGQGLRLITWTYDPLEMPNARLNITKLGGIARRYRRNIYGEEFGQLNQGLPTDRFVIEWHIAGPRVAACLHGTHAPPPGAPVPITEVAGEGPNRRLVRYDPAETARAVQVEVLPDLQALKARDLALAQDWRLKTRELFEAYFARGYAVTDFVTEGAGDARRNAYVLRDRDWGIE